MVPFTEATLRGQQDDPDPRYFERFCREAVPGMLARCEVSEELASAVGEDIQARAESFAALGQEIQDVLIAPLPKRSLTTNRKVRTCHFAARCP